MRLTATGPGSPRNGMPEPRRYRWRGQPFTPPPAPEPRRKANTPGNRRERLTKLAGMRVSDQPVHQGSLPPGVLTCQQAAWILGVTIRTVQRDLRAIREES